jgi:putrescine aminotransferase
LEDLVTVPTSSLSPTPGRPISDVDAEDISALAVRHVWHHNTQIAAYDVGQLIVLVDGDGATVRDANGREYLDATSISAVTQIGHGRVEMADAISAQVRRLEFGSTAYGFSNEPAARLGARMAELTPGDLEVCWFALSGAEANEAALKMARQYHANRGEPRRTKVLARRGSFHGMTLGALSATGNPRFRSLFEPLLPWVKHVPHPYVYRSETELGCAPEETGVRAAEALEAIVQFEGPETIAAFIAEPIAVPQAVNIPPLDYWPLVQEICKRYGILLIVDEIFTGFGRTGRMFASEHFDIRPDIMTVSKGITSGYIPLSAAIATRAVFQAFWGDDSAAFAHGGTYSGHPVACAAALANLDIIDREGLVQRSAEKGEELLNQVQAFADRPFVGNISGLGLLTGVELVSSRETRAPAPAAARQFLWDQLLDQGVIARNLGNSIDFFPPLIVTDEEISRLVTALDRGLAKLEERFPSGDWSKQD